MKNLVDKERIVVTDTISDMLTRIRNATMVKASNCSDSCYKMSLAIADILKRRIY
jgi:ribosomal protein S8